VVTRTIFVSLLLAIWFNLISSVTAGASVSASVPIHIELFLLPTSASVCLLSFYVFLPFFRDLPRYTEVLYREIDLSGSGYGPVTGCCEHGDEHSGFIKGGEFLDQLSGF